MKLNHRKIGIWLVSVCFVCVAFLIYIKTSGTANIVVDQPDSNTPAIQDRFDPNAGQIDIDTWIPVIDQAVFPHYDKNGNLDRKFGFEKVLAVVSDQWEIQKPFIDLFKPDMTCNVTADKGTVRRQAAMAGSPTSMDASFSGNVKIKITSDSDNARETIIYLDDVFYIGDKNLFFTNGDVKLISDRVNMSGKGLELIYNEDSARIEFFKIVYLDHLTFRSSSDKSIIQQTNASQTTDAKAVTVAAPVKTKPEEQKSVDITKQNTDSNAVPALTKAVTHYQIVLRDNVIINAPQQLIFADNLIVNNISEKQSSGKPSAKNSQNQSVTKNTSDTNVPAVPVAVNTVDNIAKTEKTEPNSVQENIIVTCDNGLIVRPLESPIAYEGSIKVSDQVSKTPRVLNRQFQDPIRQKLITEKITYDYYTQNVVAQGSSSMRFYVNDKADSNQIQKTIPIDVTFSKQASFTPDANLVNLQGNCVCLMSYEEQGFQKRNKLSADNIIIDLIKRKDSSSNSKSPDIKHFTAKGDIVRISSLKKLNNELISGAEIKSEQVDYDSLSKMHTIKGPGVIKIDNSNAPETANAKKSNKFSFKEKCWVVINDFKTLTYMEDANQFVADALDGDDKDLFIEYIPVLGDNKYGPKSELYAKHIVANITKNALGRNEISNLVASGGISYSEGTMQFDGSTLTYNSKDAMVIAKGDEFYPCHLNTAPLEMIEWNLKTDTKKTKLLGPATFKK